MLTFHFWSSNGILWRVLEINENNWEQWAHNVSEVLGFPESCRQRAWGQTLESSVYDQGWQGVWSLFTLHGMVESPNQEGRRACLTFSTLVLAWAQSYLLVSVRILLLEQLHLRNGHLWSNARLYPYSILLLIAFLYFLSVALMGWD